MRPAVLLAQLALCISSTHAFYPYTPLWMKEDEAEHKSSDDKRSVSENSARNGVVQRSGQADTSFKRAADEAIRLATKYAARHASKDRSLARRDNDFSIMKSDVTSENGTAGIDQDGTDYSYFVEVELGSEGKTMYMLIDTGAGSSWVMSSSCTSTACGMHNTFGPDDSTTLETSDDDFSISYGSGKVNGTLAKDTIKIAGMSFEYQFGLATSTSDQFTQFAFDGILGLAMNDGANENFLSTMDAADVAASNIFCVALNRAADGTNDGEISFGSTDSDKYEGNITYTALSHDNDWAVTIDDMSYNGTSAGVGGISAYIDTGTSFIFGPQDLVAQLHALIPGATTSDNTTYIVDCDIDESITVTFSGVDYEISSADWVSPKDTTGQCTSNVYGHEVVSGAWLLGDTFLKNVYAVFDQDQRQIGFAVNAITDASSEAQSDDATKTTDSSTMTTGATALADSTATSSPDLGLGPETDATATSTATAAAPPASSTKKSASPGRPLFNSKFTFIACIISFSALAI